MSVFKASFIQTYILKVIFPPESMVKIYLFYSLIYVVIKREIKHHNLSTKSNMSYEAGFIYEL